MYGTTQNEQTLSQPFITVTNADTLPRDDSGSARGKTYSSLSIQPVSATRAPAFTLAITSGSAAI